MADNTTLNAGAGGDTIREVDRAGVKTQVVILDLGGAGAESLLTGTLPVSNASLPLPAGASTAAKQDTGNTSVASIDSKVPALGQALAAASVPVVMTAAQVTTLTPPAAITGFALEAGHLAAIDTSTAKIPAQGQALAAASMPVVLTAAQVTTLTPPAAIAGFALDATLTGGTAKSINRGGAKGTTTAADVTSTAEGANNNALDVQIYHGGAAVNPTAIRALTSADVVTAAQATAANLNATVVQATAASLNATIVGGKTNNNAAPGATNIGVLGGLANAAVPAWTEGNLAALSTDLAGGLRTVGRPPVVTGAYRIHVTTASYNALAANAALISFRYTAAGLCIVTRVRCFVTTQTAATAAGRIDRSLMVVRGFTVADSGGTAITLTSPVGKLRTSHAATGVGNIMVSSGAALTKGTGTEDANPHGVIATAGTATEGVGLTLPRTGADDDLFSYDAGKNYPLVLAQNEGFRISIPTAMPTTIAQITAATIEWYEVAATSF